MTLAFAQVFVRNLAEDEMRRGIEAVWGREGYVRFDQGCIPNGYPALAREVVRVAWSDPDTTTTRAILVEDWDRAFTRGLLLSREWMGRDVVVVVRPPLAHTRVKAYRDGGVVLKVGEDPDDEVPYCPAISSDAEVERFLSAWRPEARPGNDICAALATIRRDCLYREALAGAWPHPLRECVFISRRSRLYRES